MKITINTTKAVANELANLTSTIVTTYVDDKKDVKSAMDNIETLRSNNYEFTREARYCTSKAKTVGENIEMEVSIDDEAYIGVLKFATKVANICAPMYHVVLGALKTMSAMSSSINASLADARKDFKDKFFPVKNESKKDEPQKVAYKPASKKVTYDRPRPKEYVRYESEGCGIVTLRYCGDDMGCYWYMYLLFNRKRAYFDEGGTQLNWEFAHAIYSEPRRQQEVPVYDALVDVIRAIEHASYNKENPDPANLKAAISDKTERYNTGLFEFDLCWESSTASVKDVVKEWNDKVGGIEYIGGINYTSHDYISDRMM